MANSVESITVTPTTDNAEASYVLKVGGTTVSNPIALSVGATTIEVVVVSAQNGDQQSYAVKVTRAAPLVTPRLTLRLSGLTSGALKLGKRLTAKGTVSPASLSGNKVVLTLQRKQGSTWVKVTTLTRTINSSGVYSGNLQARQEGQLPHGGHGLEDRRHHGSHDGLANVQGEIGRLSLPILQA